MLKEALYRASFLQIMLAFSKKLVYTVFVPAGVMELVDVVDSKSTDGDIVPVRVRPPAPKKNATMIQFS